MKILSIENSIVFYVETDGNEKNNYTRHSSDNWTVRIGESYEPIHHCEEIEQLFQDSIILESISSIIPKEIPERVNFKIHGLFPKMNNTAKYNIDEAFKSNSEKKYHYLDAYLQMMRVIHKQNQTATPYSNIAEHKRMAQRDKMITEIMSLFGKRGSRDYNHQERRLACIIDKNLFQV